MQYHQSSYTCHGFAKPGEQRNTGGGRGFHSDIIKPVGLFLCLVCGSFMMLMLQLPENKSHVSLGDMVRVSEEKSTGFVHVKARARIVPQGEFGEVSPSCDLMEFDIWRKESPCPLWSVRCGREVAFGDGTDQFGVSLGSRTEYDGPASCNPRLGFLGWLIWGSELMSVEENRAWQRGLVLTSTPWTDAHGRPKLTVTISPPAQPEMPLIKANERLCWFDVRNSKRYVFDLTSCRLESACVFVQYQGKDVVLLQTDQLDYVSESAGEAAMDELLKAAGV